MTMILQMLGQKAVIAVSLLGVHAFRQPAPRRRPRVEFKDCLIAQQPKRLLYPSPIIKPAQTGK